MHRVVAFVAALTLISPIAVFAQAPGCGLHYVAAGDDIPFGRDVEESERYPNKLVDSHLKTWGAWCEYDIAKKGTTSATYISGGQLATTWNDRPDLITLHIGEQNSTIVNLITDCFDKVKSHDFAGANSCAASVLANTTAWNGLTSNLITIQQQYRLILAGRPKLVVAILGYPNPYPHTDTATEKIAELCVPLIDTIPTCTARWVQLPPALELLDQSISGQTRKIGEVAGYLGYQISHLRPNHAHLLGYASNFDGGEKLHQVTAQALRAAANNNVEYGSDMRGGAGGGPLIQDFGDNPVLARWIGALSYYNTSTTLKIQGASTPDSRFTTLITSACAHKPGNC